MPLGARFFLVYLAFVGLGGFFVFNTVMSEIRPGVRQSTEETLVDTANLLAVFIADDLAAGTLDQLRLANLLGAYGERQPQANIWGVAKTEVSNRIYVTDGNGVVLLDSTGRDVGKDYSRWNDIYLTLRGKYGARSTPDTPGDDSSSVMYVAAPIMHAGNIIGVVTVAKPGSTLQPYIDRSQRRLAWFGGLLIALGLVLGALLSWWLSHALGRLTAYASAVSEGRRVQAPQRGGDEIGLLGAALESMHRQLEDKAYVERYVQTLTHELKSPLSAIRGAAELLREDLPAEDRRRFVAHIDDEAARIQGFAEKLLSLAVVEQRRGIEEHAVIELDALLTELCEQYGLRAQQAQLRLNCEGDSGLSFEGERFLLHQALANLLDNALDFSPCGAAIHLRAQQCGSEIIIAVVNEGTQIPDYALPRVSERFYSLARPLTGRKSSGLGLNFACEVAELHGGKLQVRNIENGVEVALILPACAR